MSPPVRPVPSLERNRRLGDWITIEAAGRVVVRSGKVELGQGVLTALAQIVAEELDVAIGRVVMEPARTGTSPNEMYTAGSMSVQHSGDALREVCARVRAIYLAEAASELFRPPDSLTVVDGEIRADYGGFTSYWALADDALLDVDAVAAVAAPTKAAGRYRLIGRTLPRLDGADKVFGRPRFIHDMRLDGQLFGRVVRPPARVAALVAVDDSEARAIDGVVTVVRDGSFLGVVAEREETAVRAADALRAASRWSEADSLPAQQGLVSFLVSSPSTATIVCDTTLGAGTELATVVRRFSRGYVAHASLAPSCSVAVWTDSRLYVWSHSQGIYQLRTELAREFGVDEADVVVEHADGAGCYGHNAADDAAYDAVRLARDVPGRPVQVVWSRRDEMRWDPFGPASVVEVGVQVGTDSRPRRWLHDVWGNGHVTRPASAGSPPLLGATHRADALDLSPATDPTIDHGGGLARNAVPIYDIPQLRVVTHRLTTMPLRTSALRALGAHLNVFAIESVVDELAINAGIDPIEFRLSILGDVRARAVLKAVAQRSGWGSAVDRGRSCGRGVGFARYKNLGAYCAVVADVEADSDVRVRHLTVAVDVGLVVNPDGVINQIEGGAVQAASWTILEQVRFDRRRVTSETWDEYPILRFDRAPTVDVILVGGMDDASVGAGEAAAGPTAAAIGNALADALGVRVRTMPLTPENIVAALP